MMKNVYKVLLPLYREAEVQSEVAQEWLMDSQGLPGLNFSQLTKVLFRIANYWCTNIDIEEYVDFLSRLFFRITTRTYPEYGTDYSHIVTLTFPVDELKISESGEESVQKGTKFDDWLECRSDESNKSEYEYKYEEDPENMMVKKYKKMRNEFGTLGQQNQTGGHIKDPFIFLEAESHLDYSSLEYLAEYKLKAIDQVYPLGYYTYIFFEQMKNDIYQKIQSVKEFNKSEITRLKRENAEQNAQHDLSKFAFEEDSGMLEDNLEKLTQGIYVTGTSFNVVITHKLYNNYRRMLRDASTFIIRPHQQFPKAGSRQKSRSQLSQGEPAFELNKFGYNPCLERRILFKLFPDSQGSSNLKFQNIHYLISTPYLESLYRSDVQKVETKGKLAIKESDEIKKEEEFINVETSFKRTREIMLSKKFGTIFQDRIASDNKEQKRLKKLVEREEKRLITVQKPGSIASKGISETFEEKSFIKMVKGPYFQLESRDGIRTDDFIYCADNDIIEAANTQAMRVLIIGKPRSGKTTLAKALALKLDLVHINVDNWIEALQQKIKTYEPPELEEGQEAPKWLSDLEEGVQSALKTGSGPSDPQIVEIIKSMTYSPQAKTRGYILDLPYYPKMSSWGSIIRQQYLIGVDENGNGLNFTHILELLTDDDEVKARAESMRADPSTGTVYSKWEREERKKPKIIPEGEEAPEEDEDNAVKPLDENTLVQRICDTEERVREEVNYYNTMERPALEELMMPLFDNQYIKLDSAGLTPDDLLVISLSRMTPDLDLPLRAKAIQIENGSDFKSLLTEGQEENQIPRKWSYWKLIDPVALSQGKVVQGTAEFAASYHNNVFVFASEENMKSFILEPKIYLQKAPQMPNIFRVLMLGPKGVGKHTQAYKLENTYGWKIVDFKEVVRAKIDEMRSLEIHIPNNPASGGRIGLSEQELAELIEGKSFPAWKFIPWIFNYLDYELEKRRPPPPEPKDPDEQPPEEDEIPEDVKKKRDQEAKKKKEEEEKKRKEEEEIQRQKEERKKRRQEAIEQGLDLVELGLEHEEEEIIIIEDLPIDQLALKINEETGKAPFVGGFILIGFPETEEQLNKLKEAGIEFDKIIYLQDTNEEEPGADVKKRMKDVELYDYDFENEFAQKILALAKEQLGEDIVKEISCNGPEDDVFIRIRNEIDPFYLKVDNPDDIRTSADLGEEDKKLPKGDFGEYCPVTYVKDNWIVRGNPEMEVIVNGKTYWLAGEKEAEEFKFNPTKFLRVQQGYGVLPLQAPPPKIMVLGQKGAGVSTQIRMLCDKFKLEELNLKDELLSKLKSEKEIRKRRRLLDRGFKAPLPPEEEGMESPPDPEIEDDPEDFDRAQHEREVLKSILDSKKGLVIDGTWTDLPEDAVSQSLQDLLFESRRVPEIVIMLKCKEKSLLSRPTIKEQTDLIEVEFKRIMEQRQIDREKLRVEERAKKQEELDQIPEEEKSLEEKEEEMKKWDEDRDAEDEAAEENDPDKPVLGVFSKDMKEKYMETLRERREKDDAFIEEFGGALKEKNVFVIDEIKTDISAEYVFIKLLDRMKDNFSGRVDLIERQMAQVLKPEEVKFYEQSYIYKHSRFGVNSPVAISNPSKSKKFAVLHRERIYFLSDEDQQKEFLKSPSKYAMDTLSIPLDIQIKPKLFVLGECKSGKSTLCKALVSRIGVIHLKMTQVIQSFIEKDSLQCERLRSTVQKTGNQVDDDLLVSLLLKRIQNADCYLNGFVLEDFPKTRNQALLLAKRGLSPTNVFFLYLNPTSLRYRNESRPTEKFGVKTDVKKTRNTYKSQNLPYVLSFYQRFYNNVFQIDQSKSRWFVEDKAIGEIQKTLEARQEFSRTYCNKDYYCCKLKDMHMDRYLAKQSLSEFKYYCPVTWKNEKQLSHCVENFEDCVLYKNAYYYFKSQRERDMFISNPDRFLINANFQGKENLSKRILPHKAAEIVSYEKQLGGHCPVTLMDEERVRKGDPLLLIQFRDNKYCFESEFKLRRFLSNPFKYSKATLPVKMPAPDDKVSLYNLSKMDDSITFMEQALGQIVTRALREVSENRLKYPTISVKETMLKLFSLFLKTNNPANTEFMKQKYQEKMKQFISRCEMPEEIFDLAKEKEKKKGVEGGWPVFKENNYNLIGESYDQVIREVAQEKLDNFMNYIR